MRVDRARAGAVGVAPHVRQQLLPPEHDAGPGQQVGQQVELGRREVDLGTVETDQPGGGVERDALVAQHDALRGVVDPPQHGPDAGDKLAGAERLGHVVVGADRQPDHEVGLVVTGGQHDDRHPPVGLDAPAHLQPVEPRQHEVEDDEVGLGGPAQLDRLLPVPYGPGLEAFAPQPPHDRVRDRGLVLHHQHCRHRRSG
jgi:hypothetical protein